jgi:hypothetical protein
MRPIIDKERWYFVDEAGDPNFYGKGKKVIVGTEGCSRVFLLGYFRVCDPQLVRARLAEVRLAISNDRYLTPIPSVQKSVVGFHATDDCPAGTGRTAECSTFRLVARVSRQRNVGF